MIETGNASATAHRHAFCDLRPVWSVASCDNGLRKATRSMVNPAPAKVAMNPIRDCDTTTPANKQAETASRSAIRKAGPSRLVVIRAAPFRQAEMASATATGKAISKRPAK